MIDDTQIIIKVQLVLTFHWKLMCINLLLQHFLRKIKLAKLDICDVLRDLVPFVQFKKREKYLQRSVTFSKVAGFQPATLQKVALPPGCFSRFLNCTNGTISHNASHITKNQSGLRFHMKICKLKNAFHINKNASHTKNQTTQVPYSM